MPHKLGPTLDELRELSRLPSHKSDGLDLTFEPRLKLGSQSILSERSGELPPLLKPLVEFSALEQERSQAGDVSIETGLKGRDWKSRKVPGFVEGARFGTRSSLRSRKGEHSRGGWLERERGFLIEEGRCKKSMGSRDHCMGGIGTSC